MRCIDFQGPRWLRIPARRLTSHPNSLSQGVAVLGRPNKKISMGGTRLLSSQTFLPPFPREMQKHPLLRSATLAALTSLGDLFKNTGVRLLPRPPSPRRSDLIGLGATWASGIFKSSPGDSTMQQSWWERPWTLASVGLGSNDPRCYPGQARRPSARLPVSEMRITIHLAGQLRS